MYVLINKNHLPSLMLNKNLLQEDSMVCFGNKNPHILMASALTQRMGTVPPSAGLVDKKREVAPTPGAPKTRLDDPDSLPN